MPGEPRQARHIGRARLDQRLGRRHHLDQRAVVEHERVVGAQAGGLGESNLDAAALDAGHDNILRAALGVIENDGVDDRPAAALGGL